MLRSAKCLSAACSNTPPLPLRRCPSPTTSTMICPYRLVELVQGADARADHARDRRAVAGDEGAVVAVGEDPREARGHLIRRGRVAELGHERRQAVGVGQGGVAHGQRHGTSDRTTDEGVGDHGPSGGALDVICQPQLMIAYRGPGGSAGTFRSRRRCTATAARESSVRMRPSSTTSRTSRNDGGAREINGRRNATVNTSDSDERETIGPSAGKTFGPVERVAQPEAPGCHHQTPCGSRGSTAMQRPRPPLPTASGVLVTMYRPSGGGAGRRQPAIAAVMASTTRTSAPGTLWRRSPTSPESRWHI